MTGEEKIKLLNMVLSDIRELRQILVAKDVGALVELKIVFKGGEEGFVPDSEPTVVKIYNRCLTDEEVSMIV